MDKKESKFGTTLRGLENTHPADYARIVHHFGEEYLDWTLGEIAHYADVDCDPRVRAANAARGDFTAIGGSGPKRS